MWRSLASAPARDAGGRRFKSGHPDLRTPTLLELEQGPRSVKTPERGAGGARPLWKRGAWVRFPPFRLTARGPTVGQWSVKPRRFGASGFNSRLAVSLRALRGGRVPPLKALDGAMSNAVPQVHVAERGLECQFATCPVLSRSATRPGPPQSRGGEHGQRPLERPLVVDRTLQAALRWPVCSMVGGVRPGLLGLGRCAGAWLGVKEEL